MPTKTVKKGVKQINTIKTDPRMAHFSTFSEKFFTSKGYKIISVQCAGDRTIEKVEKTEKGIEFTDVLRRRYRKMAWKEDFKKQMDKHRKFDPEATWKVCLINLLKGKDVLSFKVIGNTPNTRQVVLHALNGVGIKLLDYEVLFDAAKELWYNDCHYEAGEGGSPLICEI